MNLVFIYGPPAVGKTTIGRELAALTGYRFFYNHLTVPAAKAIFPDSQEPHPNPAYTQLLHSLRLTGLEAAAAAGLDTIFTIAYSGAVDDPFITRIVDVFESHGGKVHFAELHAPEDELFRHVAEPEREALHMGKMTDPKRLQALLETRNMFCTVPYSNVLKLDTSKIKPRQAAQKIIEKFGLATQISTNKNKDNEMSEKNEDHAVLDELSGFLKAYERAANSRVFAKVDPFIATDASFWFTNGMFNGKVAIKKAFEDTWKTIENESYSISNVQWIFSDRQTASCTYTFKSDGIVDGRRQTYEGKGTNILARIDGKWQIVHEHLSK